MLIMVESAGKKPSTSPERTALYSSLWESWVEKKMLPWGLRIITTKDTLNREVTTRIVNQKYDPKRNPNPEKGILATMKAPKTLEGRSGIVCTFGCVSFEKADPHQQAMTMAFISTFPKAVFYGQTNPQFPLTDLKRKFNKEYQTFLKQVSL